MVAPILASLFSIYFYLDAVPSSWKRSLICPVPKKGDLSMISNYRPISLTEVTRKIYEMCLLDRLKAVTPLSREQGEFRECRSTIDQIQALGLVVDQSKQDGKKVHLAFLDIKAAYDSVPRAELWRRCDQLGIDPLLVSSLRSLFDHNSAQLALSQRRSAPFGLSAGVLQGSVLSPLLYSIYLDPLVDALRQGPSPSLPYNDGRINCFLYADDIALVAHSAADLNSLLAICEADSLQRGYRFSPAKCVVVSSGQTTHRIYGNPISRQDSFCYLGIEFNQFGISMRKHVESRISKAERMAKNLNLAGARFRNFPVRVNLHLYTVFIRPGLEYGLPLLLGDRKALHLLEMCQKRIVCGFLGVNINSRNDVVQAISNCPPIAIRQLLLRHTRAVRLSRTWNSPEWPSCALPFVLRCSFGDDLVLDDDIDVTLKYCQVRRRAFYVPVEASLRQRTNGTVSRGLLRWLLNAPLTPGVFRTLLLWILGKWRQFTPKPCMKCQEPFTRQMHVITCSSLPFRLLASFRRPSSLG
jgi:hypothetical protein